MEEIDGSQIRAGTIPASALQTGVVPVGTISSIEQLQPLVGDTTGQKYTSLHTVKQVIYLMIDGLIQTPGEYSVIGTSWNMANPLPTTPDVYAVYMY